MPLVTIYKVTVPSYYAYPSWKVIIKVCYTKEEAERFIENYPNLFLRSWLKIEPESFKYQATD